MDGISFSDTQTVTLEPGVSEKNTLSFALVPDSKVTYGGLSVSLVFSDVVDSNGVNQDIKQVQVRLYADADRENPIDSKTITNFASYEGSEYEGIADSGSKLFVVDYKRTISDINSRMTAGEYWLTFDFYADGTLFPINSVPYSVHIARGITTKHEQLIYLNKTYTITYHLNEGESICAGETVIYKYSRKSADITLPKAQKSGYGFAGWYRDSGFENGPYDIIYSGYTGNIDLYPYFAKTAKGNISTSNRTLKIEPKIVVSEDLQEKNITRNFSDGVYLNDTVELCITDSDGKILSKDELEDLSIDARIKYKGREIGINHDSSLLKFKLAVDGYQDEGFVISGGDYQLYVAVQAEINDFIYFGSDTFTFPVNDMAYYYFDVAATTNNDDGNAVSTLKEDIKEFLNKAKDYSMYLRFYGNYKDSTTFSDIKSAFTETFGDNEYSKKLILDMGDVVNASGMIPESWFRGCEYLYGIVLPTKWTTNFDGTYGIGKGAFWGCINLTEIVIPIQCSAIYKEAFAYCYGLSKVTFDCVKNETGSDYWYQNSAELTSADDWNTTLTSDKEINIKNPETNAENLTNNVQPEAGSNDKTDWGNYYLYNYENDETYVSGS